MLYTILVSESLGNVYYQRNATLYNLVLPAGFNAAGGLNAGLRGSGGGGPVAASALADTSVATASYQPVAASTQKDLKLARLVLDIPEPEGRDPRPM